MIALSAMPSTSVALVVTRSATLGVANGIAATAGIVLGDLAFITLAILGLTVAAKAMGSLFMLVKIVGGLYLLWLGLSLFFKSGSTSITTRKTGNGRNLLASFIAGFVLTLGDIKAIVFYASLLPAFMDLSTIQASDMATIAIITVVSVGGVKSTYAIFANKVAAYAEKANMETAARKMAGGLMVGAGGYLIVKT